MTKNVIIIVQTVMLVWFGSALARVENERYARSLDMCPHVVLNGVQLPFVECKGVETRIPPAWLWHIVAALLGSE